MTRTKLANEDAKLAEFPDRPPLDGGSREKGGNEDAKLANEDAKLANEDAKLAEFRFKSAPNKKEESSRPGSLPLAGPERERWGQRSGKIPVPESD